MKSKREIYGSWIGKTFKITIDDDALIKAMASQVIYNKSNEAYEAYGSIHGVLLSDKDIENMIEEMKEK